MGAALRVFLGHVGTESRVARLDRTLRPGVNLAGGGRT
jgi:hypothetical protein